jgi:hypothetical protein
VAVSSPREDDLFYAHNDFREAFQSHYVLPDVADQLSSKSVLNVIQSASDEFSMGEKSLEESCESLRRRLDECTKKLDESSSSIQTSTSQALQSFESKVVETRNGTSHLSSVTEKPAHHHSSTPYTSL